MAGTAGGTVAGGAAIFLGGDFFPWGEGRGNLGGGDFGAGFFFFNCGADFFLFFAAAGFAAGFGLRTTRARMGAANFRVGFLRWAIILSLEGMGQRGKCLTGVATIPHPFRRSTYSLACTPAGPLPPSPRPPVLA